MPTPRSFTDLRHRLATERFRLAQHHLYASLRSVDDIRTFMGHHVFAVWDFMSLVKELQRSLTCVEVPWVPRASAEAARLINEIVLGEESDELGRGFVSHFEFYLGAMRECGASTEAIDRTIAAIRDGANVRDAMTDSGTPRGARRFVESTFEAIESGSLPRVAAAFTVGREELIPEMFASLVRDVSARTGPRLTRFVEYLERHVHIDGERHGPMSARLLESVCGDDQSRWEDAYTGAREALVARGKLWDTIASNLLVRRSG